MINGLARAAPSGTEPPAVRIRKSSRPVATTVVDVGDDDTLAASSKQSQNGLRHTKSCPQGWGKHTLFERRPIFASRGREGANTHTHTQNTGERRRRPTSIAPPPFGEVRLAPCGRILPRSRRALRGGDRSRARLGMSDGKGGGSLSQSESVSSSSLSCAAPPLSFGLIENSLIMGPDLSARNTNIKISSAATQRAQKR